MEQPRRREDRVTWERRAELYQDRRTIWATADFWRLAAKRNDIRLRSMGRKLYRILIILDGRKGQCSARGNDGRSGPLAEISLKGNKVANRSTGMGKYGRLPESVNDVSTIRVEITSRNHLVGGQDRYSGDVGLGDWTGTSKEVRCLRRPMAREEVLPRAF
jgi:hypothetical protein